MTIYGSLRVQELTEEQMWSLGWLRADIAIVGKTEVYRPPWRQLRSRLRWVRRYGRGRPYVKRVSSAVLKGVSID